MKTADTILRLLLETEEDPDWKDVVYTAVPDPRPHPKGAKYGTEIEYEGYKLNWHDYPDGSRIVSLYYRSPQLHPAKNGKWRWKPGWSGATNMVTLKPGYNWDEWLKIVISAMERHPIKSPNRFCSTQTIPWLSDLSRDLSYVESAHGGAANLLEADEDDFDAKDVFYDEDGFTELAQLVDWGVLSLSGRVTRVSHRYVHERSTTCDLEGSFDWPDDMPDEQCDAEDERLIGDIRNLEADINERMVGWNHEMYRELEAAYDDHNSDEQVAENIEANGYEFNAEGRREDGTGITYEQLDDDAKERARNWWREAGADDNYWSEPVVAEWKWLLDQKGFYGVEINWTGFWSQGDGASFTATSIDFAKYFHFPDPLEFPEQNREQLGESEDEDVDTKDLAFGPVSPVGYVLKSKVPNSTFPWFHTRWSDTGNSCGNFRRYIGDAKVYKRLSTAQSYSTLEIVPVYSDPRRNGNGALDPYYVKPVYNFKPRPVEDNPWAEEDVNESRLVERRTGASRERAIFYHGTSAQLVPKILSEGLVPDPKQRSWQDDPHSGLVQPTRKSLEGIYVTTSLSTATGAALRVAQRDKVNQAVVVMSLQPRSLVADEDSVKYGILALASHLSDHVYSHIWPYFMEFYGDRLGPDYDHYREGAAKQKREWVDAAAKQLLYKFKDTATHPALEQRVKDLLFQKGFPLMLERMVSYTGDWDMSSYRREWSHGFGTYEDAPPKPDPAVAEAKLLAFSDQLSRALKDTARPSKVGHWSLNVNGRLLSPVGFSGSNKILCIIEIGRSSTQEYRSQMIVHYGKPPTQLIKDWTEAQGPVDQPGDIVYKNNVQEALSHGDALRTTGFWGEQAAGCIIAARDTRRILLPKRSDQVLQPHTWGTWGGAVDEDDFEVKDLAQTTSAQHWLFKIEEWPTCKSLNYFVSEDPEDQASEVQYRIPGPCVGGHTFPKRTKNNDLRLLAQAQIRQFKKTGYYDPRQWHTVWDWMREMRQTAARITEGAVGPSAEQVNVLADKIVKSVQSSLRSMPDFDSMDAQLWWSDLDKQLKKHSPKGTLLRLGGFFSTLKGGYAPKLDKVLLLIPDTMVNKPEELRQWAAQILSHELTHKEQARRSPVALTPGYKPPAPGTMPGKDYYQDPKEAMAHAHMLVQICFRKGWDRDRILNYLRSKGAAALHIPREAWPRLLKYAYQYLDQQL